MKKTRSKKTLNIFMRIFKIIFKGLGFILLILLYLFFIYWIGLFYYLGSYTFPYLFIFLLLPFLLGYFSGRSVKKTIILKNLPLFTAIAIFSIYIGFSSGIMRFLGWFRDLGFNLILFIIASLIITYLGWFLKRRVGKIRRLIVPIVSSLFILATVIQFYTPGYSKYYWIKEGAMSFICQNLEDESYDEVFNTICEYLEEKYPYFGYKDVDWKKIKKQAQENLKKVKKDEDFHEIIDKMLKQFHDGHLKFYSPPKPRPVYVYTGIRIIRIEGKCYISEVIPNSPAEKAGLKLGMQIIKVDNKPVELYRYYHLTYERADTTTSFTTVFDKEEKTIRIDLPEKPWKKPIPVITYKRLPEGYGYIKIRKMAVDMFSFVQSFDKALENLWNTKGLIIDIRDNPGGAIILTDQILGRFTNQKVKYGGILNRQGKFSPLFVIPRNPIYEHSIVILINKRNASAADFFAYAASHLDRITLVGRPTAGVVSSPSKLIKLPGGAKVELVGSGLADTSGNYVVEDIGVRPDVKVSLTIPDIKSGKDRDLLTAIKILNKKNSE